MKLVVYIDVYLFMNGIFNLCILLLVGRLYRCRQRLLRLIAGAAAGGLGAAIVLVLFDLSPILLAAWQYVWLPGLMLVISFGFSDKKSFFYQLLTFYAITLFLGGSFVFFRQEGGKLWKITGILVILEIFLWVLFPGLQKRNQELKNEYEVAFLLGEDWIYGRALLDTGNRLYEPFTKRPVILAEFQKVKQELPPGLLDSIEKQSFSAGEGMEKIRWIPYHAVGTTCGLLPGIEAKKMRIRMPGKIITKEKVLLGLVFEPLAVRGEYQFILHEDIMC